MKRHTFTPKKAEKLLDLLVDAEGPIKDLLGARGQRTEAHSAVCDALRAYADGDVKLPPSR